MKTLREEFKKEADCHNYCTKEAEKRILQKDYIGAAVFLENSVRSLKEMDKLMKQKQDLESGKIPIKVQQMRGRY